MEAIVLCGGKGIRLGKLTQDCPKPMLPLDGRPFLSFLFDYWILREVDKFILAVGYKQDTIMNHFGGYYKTARLIYSIDQKSGQGPEAAITQALKHLGTCGTFLVMNGDTLLFDKPYIDIGTPEDYEKAKRLFASDHTQAVGV